MGGDAAADSGGDGVVSESAVWGSASVQAAVAGMEARRDCIWVESNTCLLALSRELSLCDN
ncbi:hypothetical protein AKI39_20765 [Bordetella sp. H567]|nr:hypothetical protein AKI39_20765 [Bordetella sp. H567]